MMYERTDEPFSQAASMTLGKQTMLILTAILIVLTLMLHIVSYFGIRDDFLKVERRYALHNIERLKNAVVGRIDDIDLKAVDWATWDAMYEFAQNPDSEFIKSSLVNTCTRCLS